MPWHLGVFLGFTPSRRVQPFPRPRTLTRSFETPRTSGRLLGGAPFDIPGHPNGARFGRWSTFEVDINSGVDQMAALPRGFRSTRLFIERGGRGATDMGQTHMPLPHSLLLLTADGGARIGFDGAERGSVPKGLVGPSAWPFFLFPLTRKHAPMPPRS